MSKRTNDTNRVAARRKTMYRNKTVWCYIDGKKHCDVTQWALAANVDIKTAKDMLTAQYPGMTVTFKVI